MKKQKDHVVLSLSGGLDSSTLLLRCLSEYKSVTCISFDYGQKHRVELERAQQLVDYINGNITQRIKNIFIKGGIPKDKQEELDLDTMQREWVENMEKVKFKMIDSSYVITSDDTLLLAAYLRLFNYFYVNSMQDK